MSTSGLMQARQASHQAAGPHEQGEQGNSAGAGAGLLQALTGGFAKELAALREGIAYISAPKNRCSSISQQCMLFLVSMSVLPRSVQEVNETGMHCNVHCLEAHMHARDMADCAHRMTRMLQCGTCHEQGRSSYDPYKS